MSHHSNSTWLFMQIVACQAHPALVKIGLVLARLFHFGGLLESMPDFLYNLFYSCSLSFCSFFKLRIDRLCLVAARRIWRLYGDPAPLARDNIVDLWLCSCSSTSTKWEVYNQVLLDDGNRIIIPQGNFTIFRQILPLGKQGKMKWKVAQMLANEPVSDFPLLPLGTSD